MGMFDAMHISASGLSAERLRMDVIAQNLANVNTTVDPNDPNAVPYQRHEVLFQAAQMNDNSAVEIGSGVNRDTSMPKLGVEVSGVVLDGSSMREVYDPSHPHADANGIVKLPNINPVTEMVDMMTATRAYEANVTAMNAAKNMALKALDILR